MLIPDYWAEAQLKHRQRGRNVTIRRLGWSLDSQQQAQAMAEQRAQAALDGVLAGEPLNRRESRRGYHGAEGVPIREQVLERVAGAVITRNSYGAECLNVADVCFADVDYRRGCPLWWRFPGLLAVLIGLLHLPQCNGLAEFWQQPLGGGLIIGGTLWLLTAGIVHRALLRLAGGAEALALRRLRRFVKRHRHWALRVYRTPAGLRLMAVHQRLSPDDAEVQALFRRSQTDPLYQRMCQRQRCFRARLSAKPWRIGISERLRPRGGGWPLDAERLSARQRWVERYRHKAAQYAACHYVCTIGSSAIDPTIAELVRLHDERCQSLRTDLPLA